ncbi:permease prefix domain 1-containing protein [Agromyces seonyuensis]|uniref:Uncharacterized protein n=1 Tax=Agromyces seonyuensis TaxID=2662446 RepID=A0A6I4NY14_9MICO|nr:permease prefix domain 1-containing protein [Agromyces seonyuensis]MWB99061.1 hypothetical protein [Agromyces seonyuensis]
MNASDAARSTGDLHRRLDDLFAGVPMTADTQDLKEEIRANLIARVAELESEGRSPAESVSRAFAELGDVHELLGEPAAAQPPVPEYLRNRVRPSGAFVVRTVLCSIVAAAALVLLIVGLTPALPLVVGVLIGLAVVWGAGIGIVTGDALAQETASDYPMPRGRAAQYGAATGILLAGLALVPVVIVSLPLAWVAVPAALAVGAIAWLSYLGATQTNRHKPWVVAEAQRAGAVGNRFSEDPAAAARFGIYTVVIWLLAGILALVLGFTVGWLWAPLAAVGGFVVFMLTLARMLFGAGR